MFKTPTTAELTAAYLYTSQHPRSLATTRIIEQMLLNKSKYEIIQLLESPLLTIKSISNIYNKNKTLVNLFTIQGVK